jgi:uncharacterized protein YcgI (DUF1989 family)
MPWSGLVPQGHYLSIVDLEGQQGVDFLCYNAARPEERYYAPNTIKASRDLKLTRGRLCLPAGRHGRARGDFELPANEQSLQ